MKWYMDPQIISAIAGAIGSLGALLAALAAYFRSRANSAKLDENTRLTQTNADNHADTMAKLDTLATKVVSVVPAEPTKKDPS
jgi:hypothetical protein